MADECARTPREAGGMRYDGSKIHAVGKVPVVADYSSSEIAQGGIVRCATISGGSTAVLSFKAGRANRSQSATIHRAFQKSGWYDSKALCAYSTFSSSIAKGKCASGRQLGADSAGLRLL